MPDISRTGRSPSSSSSSATASVRQPGTSAATAATATSEARDAGPTDAIERRREGSHATVRPAAASTTAPAGTVAVKRGLAAPAKKYDASKDASTLYTAMKGGMTGWGTDEKAIHDVLRGKSPEQVKALRAAYADKYPGRDLDKDLKSELSGSDLKSAMRVMTAKTTLPPAVDVRRDAKTALTTLASASPKERAAIAAAHQKENGTSLAADIDTHLKGDDAIRARALLGNDDGLAKAAQLHQAMRGLGTDEATIDEVLSSSTPQERKGIEQKYAAQYGTSLRAALNAELSGTDLQTATSLLDGDSAAVTASRLRAAMKGMGTDKAAIEKALAGTSADERAAAAAAFHQQTGTSLDAALSSELDAHDLDDARTLVRDGSLSDAQRLDRAMRGLGTNEGELKAVLEGKSKAEIDALSTAYAARTGRSLHDAIHDELGGRDRFDAQMLLRGSVDLSTDAGIKEAVARAGDARLRAPGARQHRRCGAHRAGRQR
ncbi:MAG TPA: annexin, partial [Myxococcota bacterium]